MPVFSWTNKSMCRTLYPAGEGWHSFTLPVQRIKCAGPTTRADVDTRERVQERQAGCPGTGAQGIPGNLEELGFFILEKRWLLGSHCYLQLPDGVIDKGEPGSSLSCMAKGLNSVWMWGIIPCHDGDQAQKAERPCTSFLSAIENPAEKERPWAPWPAFDFGLTLSRVWARDLWRALTAWVILLILYLYNSLSYK